MLLKDKEVSFSITNQPISGVHEGQSQREQSAGGRESLQKGEDTC